MSPSKRKSSTSPSAPLPNTLIVPYSPPVRRLLSRLSKDSLLELVLTWLDSTTVHLYSPNFTGSDGEDDEYLEIDVVRETYEGYKQSRTVKAKDIAQRVIEREWRSGLNLLQIAELDYRYLLDHPTAHKWTAATLHPLNRSSSDTTPPVPRFHAAAFTHALHTTMRPLITSHYFIARHPTLPLTLLRLQLHPSGTTALELPGPRRIFWLVFPASAPGYLYHNIATRGTDNLRDIVRVSIATAISRPHARFELRPSAMSAKTLETLCYYRGSGGGEGGMIGAWSIYSDGTLESGPLEVPPPKRQAEDIDMGETGDEETTKRQKIAEGRFGSSAMAGDGKGLEVVEFRIEDKFPALPVGVEIEDDADFRPTITLRLEGSHVFAGVRGMVEEGVGFDGMKMPGWITGEGCVSVGTVRDGKLLKKKKWG